jgi:hypothetical protein
MREELGARNARAKNLKSQLARARNADAARREEINGQVVAAESRALELRTEIQRHEKQRIDEKDLHQTMASFDEVWKQMTLGEQRALLGQLAEKVGFDSRSGKVTVSFRSASIKALCKK